MPITVTISDMRNDVSVCTAYMFMYKGYCVDTCDTDHQVDENNTCVECDGECPQKSSSLSLSLRLSVSICVCHSILLLNVAISSKYFLSRDFL